MTRTSSEVDLPVLVGASELVSKIFSIEALSCGWQKENYLNRPKYMCRLNNGKEEYRQLGKRKELSQLGQLV